MMATNSTIGDYSIIQRLGQNRAGGRYTWLAEKDGEQFVVKQFSFSKDANWDGFKALEREVEILKSLDHPQIPKYVDFFDTSDGWCLVQQYIKAESLAGQQRSPDQVKDIAIQVLQILVYLQSLNSPLIHRDIKPENLLQTKDGTIYLVDFGFSRAGFDDLSASSVMLGTVGFMPPEYMFGGPPTKAADLYSLGATLICLLTGTPTHRMGELIEDFSISDKAFEQCTDEGFRDWLVKLTKMRVVERFQDAQEALDVLAPSVLLKTPDLPDLSLKIDSSQEYYVAKDGTIYNPQKLREKIEYLRDCLSEDPHKLDDQRKLAYLSEIESNHYDSIPERLSDKYSIPEVQQKIHSLSIACQKDPTNVEHQLSLAYFGDIYRKLSLDARARSYLDQIKEEDNSISMTQWSFKVLFSLVPFFLMYFFINFFIPQLNLLCKLAEVGECIPSSLIRR